MYDLIVYKVINFKIPRGNKMINKRYFQKVYTSKAIDKKDVTIRYQELKKRYNDWCYIISDIESGQNDWYIDNLNKKSETAYKNYIIGGAK